MRRIRSGLGHQSDLTIVELHAVGNDRAGAENAAVEELFERPTAEAPKRLLHFPDRLRGMGVDAGVELFGELECPSKGFGACNRRGVRAQPTNEPARLRCFCVTPA